MPDRSRWKTGIRKLEDRFGDYVLVMTCKACGHCRRSPPEVLAKIVGWTAEIDQVMRRMRCSACGARGADWDVDRVPRPRR